MDLGLCECGEERATQFLTPQDELDPWPVGPVCLSELEQRLAEDGNPTVRYELDDPITLVGEAAFGVVRGGELLGHVEIRRSVPVEAGIAPYASYGLDTRPGMGWIADSNSFLDAVHRVLRGEGDEQPS